MLAVVLTTGCNGSGSDGVDRPGGSAAVVVSALSATDVASATVSITATDIPVPVTAELSYSNGWQTTIDGIPAGTGRTFTLSALDARGTERYHGETGGVAVGSGQVQPVVIVAQQTSQPVPFRDAVPVIDLVEASSNPVTPGAVVRLNVVAHDPDPGDVLAFAWTASTGALASPSAQSTTWTAPSIQGTYPINVVVSDSQNETATATLQITVATPPTPAPIPRLAVWLLAGLLAAAYGPLSQGAAKRGAPSVTH